MDHLAAANYLGCVHRGKEEEGGRGYSLPAHIVRHDALAETAEHRENGNAARSMPVYVRAGMGNGESACARELGKYVTTSPIMLLVYMALIDPVCNVYTRISTLQSCV